MKLAVTGHRPNKLNNEYDTIGPWTLGIYYTLLGLVKTMKPELMISGMALGVDMIWAELALDLKIPLLAAIPFKGQSSTWSTTSKEKYNDVLANPLTTTVIVSPGGYSPDKMHKRNHYMVDQLTNKQDMLIAVWDGTSGGTAGCVSYATTKIGKERIIRIQPIESMRNYQHLTKKPKEV